MNLRLGAMVVLTGVAMVLPARAGEIKSGPTDQISGPFDVRAITGEHRKGDVKDQLCYVCKYGAEARPAGTAGIGWTAAVPGHQRKCDVRLLRTFWTEFSLGHGSGGAPWRPAPISTT